MSPTTRPWRTEDVWARLRERTRARIALGRAGAGLPTAALLEFQAAHAQARDAVHAPFETGELRETLARLEHPCMSVASRAGDRARYLQRPDLGRRLRPEDRERLGAPAGVGRPSTPDLVVVIGDGLSATATMAHAGPVLERLLAALPAHGVDVGPVVLAEQARVALADEIGEALAARQTLILLGERPGLSSPDSLSGYLTWAPRVGRRDSERNCVSNIRPVGGLSYDAAAHTLIYLILEARRRCLTGVELKDESAGLPSLLSGPRGFASPGIQTDE